MKSAEFLLGTSSKTLICGYGKRIRWDSPQIENNAKDRYIVSRVRLSLGENFQSFFKNLIQGDLFQLANENYINKKIRLLVDELIKKDSLKEDGLSCNIIYVDSCQKNLNPSF